MARHKLSDTEIQAGLAARPGWTLVSSKLHREYKFTNTYRASDRVSQYLIRNVIYEGAQSAEEVFFRTILFKLFNRRRHGFRVVQRVHWRRSRRRRSRWRPALI